MERPERPPLPVMPKPKWPYAQKFPSKFYVKSKAVPRGEPGESDLCRLKSGSACVIDSVRERSLTKSLSCNEIREQFELRSAQSTSTTAIDHLPPNQVKIGEHKTVIYFGDSILHKRATDKEAASDSDARHASRLCEEMLFKRQKSIRMPTAAPTVKVDLQPMQATSGEKTMNEASSEGKSKPRIAKPDRKKLLRAANAEDAPANAGAANKGDVIAAKSARNNDAEEKTQRVVGEKRAETESDAPKVPSFAGGAESGVINIKIEGSYGLATKLVQSVAKDERDGISEEHYNDLVSEDVDNIFHDWSFVQDWRTR